MKLVFKFSDTGRTWSPSFGAIHTLRLTFNSPQKAAWWLALLTMLAGLSATAVAQQQVVQSAGIFDDVTEQYRAAALSWEGGLRGIANNLFGLLAVISLAWTFIKLALQKDDIKAFIPTVAMQILTLGFFYYLVENGSKIAVMIIASFERAASIASPTSANAMSPSMVASTGFDVFYRIGERISDFGLSDSLTVGLPLSIVSLMILVAFCGVAILLLVTLIESMFVIYGGILLLGFGALPWTRDIPKNYLIYAINVGVKLFVLNLVVGIGVGFSESWPAQVQGTSVGDLMTTAAGMFVGGLIFMAVAWKVPGIAAAISSGSLNFNAGDAMGMTAAAAGTGAAVGAMATGGAAALGGGLASATRGAVQASSAGMSLAAEQGASGMKAAVKGLGNAASATMSEVGSSIKSGMGLAPPSKHSVDARGRDVDSFATRAANNLGEQAQALRETKAGAPTASGASQPGSSNTGTGPTSNDAEKTATSGSDGDAPKDTGAAPSTVLPASADSGVAPAAESESSQAVSVADTTSAATAGEAGTEPATATAEAAQSANAAEKSSVATPASNAATPAPPPSGGEKSTAKQAPGQQFKPGSASAPQKLMPPELPPPDGAVGGVSISFDARDD